jgi:hypothetical protein
MIYWEMFERMRFFPPEKFKNFLNTAFA